MKKMWRLILPVFLVGCFPAGILNPACLAVSDSFDRFLLVQVDAMTAGFDPGLRTEWV